MEKYPFNEDRAKKGEHVNTRFTLAKIYTISTKSPLLIKLEKMDKARAAKVIANWKKKILKQA